MLDPPAPRRAKALRQLLVRADYLRIGGVADRMGRDLIAIGRGLIGLRQHFGVGHEAQAARFGLVAIRRLQPGPARPQRPVGVQFDPGDPQPPIVQPAAWLAAVDRLHSGDAAGIAHDPHLEHPRHTRAVHRRPAIGVGAHVGRAGQSVAQHRLLRLGQRGIEHRVTRRGDLALDQPHRPIDEQAILDPPISWRRRCGSDPGSGQRGFIADRGMAVDTIEPHRPIADHRVEIGRGREFLVGPHFLVPAATADPAFARVGARVSGESLLQFGERLAARQIELQRRKTEPHHMAMRIDQPGQNRPPAGIDNLCVRKLHFLATQQALHPPVVADQHAGKMLQLSVGADLHNIGMVDQRIGSGGGSGEQRGERDQGCFHGDAHSIVPPRANS